MFKFKLGAAAIALIAFTGAAHAGDTLSLEFSPEWKTKDGTAADDYVKLGYSHSFDNNFVVGGSFQHQWRFDATSSSIEQVEGSVGYKLKSGPFTLTPSFILGYGFGNLPSIDPVVKTNDELYYAITLAADVKLSDAITWNAFQVRYRNAFNVTWITPKIQTGVTWNIDKTNAVYVNVGYAWKDTGGVGQPAGLQGDKWNVAVGYKLNF